MWLYFALGFAAPLVLESQGFYNRPAVNLRKALFWPLLRGSLIVTVGMVLLMFYFKAPTLRGVSFIFIVFSCALVWLKEELLLAALHSRLAKAQYKRRIILAGSHAETARLRKLMLAQAGDEIEVAAEFNLAESPPQVLIEMLHEHSVSGVLVSATHAQFERVENVIKLCEIEGVEAWLVADFFATQIARASFDELFGPSANRVPLHPGNLVADAGQAAAGFFWRAVTAPGFCPAHAGHCPAHQTDFHRAR